MNHLARLRLRKPQLAGHLIDASGLGELRLSQPQLAVFLAQLISACFSDSTR